MRRTTLALIAAIAALDYLGGTSQAAAQDCDSYYSAPYRCRGFVIPCSLDGVNPAYHPSIFANPRIARQEYGFIRARDGSWHVEPGCVRGQYHGG